MRTTILVRRRERRQKIEDAKAAAVFGIKQAGRRSASAAAEGASSAAQGAARFVAWGGPRLKQASIAGARGTAAGIRIAAARTWGFTTWALAGIAAGGARGLRGTGRLLAPALARASARGAALLAPLADFLRRPAIQLPLMLIAGVSGLSAIFGAWTFGFDGGTLTAGAIALAGLALVLATRMGDSGWRNSRISRFLERAGDMVVLVPGFDRLGRGQATLALVLIVASVAGGWWLLSEPTTTTTTGIYTAAARRDPATSLDGRAVALSGSALRIGEATIALDGIEAPERNQECLRDGKRWRCGEAAKDALARMIRGKRISCDVTGSRDDAMRTGRCSVRGDDLAEALVREGHVFAEQSIFARYATQESDARRAGLGLWSGEADRPADFRAKRWEEARRNAPDGCPIKGRVASGSRVYVLPWSPAYDSVRVVSARGERWFCSEAEAQAAGWRPVSPSS